MMIVVSLLVACVKGEYLIEFITSSSTLIKDNLKDIQYYSPQTLVISDNLVAAVSEFV